MNNNLTSPTEMNIINKIKLLGLELPEISTPGGSYNSVNIRGNKTILC